MQAFVLYLASDLYCYVHVYIYIIIGKYWDNCAIKKPSSRSQDDEACRRLWDYSAELVGVDMDQEMKTDSE